MMKACKLIISLIFCGLVVHSASATFDPVTNLCLGPSGCPNSAMIWASGTFTTVSLSEASFQNPVGLYLQLSLCCDYKFKQGMLLDKRLYRNFLAELLRASPLSTIGSNQQMKLFPMDQAQLHSSSTKALTTEDGDILLLHCSPLGNEFLLDDVYFHQEPSSSSLVPSPLAEMELFVSYLVLQCRCPHSLMVQPILFIMRDILPPLHLSGIGPHCVGDGYAQQLPGDAFATHFELRDDSIPSFAVIEWSLYVAATTDATMMAISNRRHHTVRTVVPAGRANRVQSPTFDVAPHTSYIVSAHVRLGRDSRILEGFFILRVPYYDLVPPVEFLEASFGQSIVLQVRSRRRFVTDEMVMRNYVVVSGYAADDRNGTSNSRLFPLNSALILKNGENLLYVYVQDRDRVCPLVTVEVHRVVALYAKIVLPVNQVHSACEDQIDLEAERVDIISKDLRQQEPLGSMVVSALWQCAAVSSTASTSPNSPVVHDVGSYRTSLAFHLGTVVHCSWNVVITGVDWSLLRSTEGSNVYIDQTSVTHADNTAEARLEDHRVIHHRASTVAKTFDIVVEVKVFQFEVVLPPQAQAGQGRWVVLLPAQLVQVLPTGAAVVSASLLPITAQLLPPGIIQYREQVVLHDGTVCPEAVRDVRIRLVQSLPEHVEERAEVFTDMDCVFLVDPRDFTRDELPFHADGWTLIQQLHRRKAQEEVTLEVMQSNHQRGCSVCGIPHDVTVEISWEARNSLGSIKKSFSIHRCRMPPLVESFVATDPTSGNDDTTRITPVPFQSVPTIPVAGSSVLLRYSHLGSATPLHSSFNTNLELQMEVSHPLMTNFRFGPLTASQGVKSRTSTVNLQLDEKWYTAEKMDNFSHYQLRAIVTAKLDAQSTKSEEEKRLHQEFKKRNLCLERHTSWALFALSSMGLVKTIASNAAATNAPRFLKFCTPSYETMFNPELHSKLGYNFTWTCDGAEHFSIVKKSATVTSLSPLYPGATDTCTFSMFNAISGTKDNLRLQVSSVRSTAVYKFRSLEEGKLLVGRSSEIFVDSTYAVSFLGKWSAPTFLPQSRPQLRIGASIPSSFMALADHMYVREVASAERHVLSAVVSDIPSSGVVTVRYEVVDPEHGDFCSNVLVQDSFDVFMAEVPSPQITTCTQFAKIAAVPLPEKFSKFFDALWEVVSYEYAPGSFGNTTLITLQPSSPTTEVRGLDFGIVKVRWSVYRRSSRQLVDFATVVVHVLSDNIIPDRVVTFKDSAAVLTTTSTIDWKLGSQARDQKAQLLFEVSSGHQRISGAITLKNLLLGVTTLSYHSTASKRLPSFPAISSLFCPIKDQRVPFLVERVAASLSGTTNMRSECDAYHGNGTIQLMLDGSGGEGLRFVAKGLQEYVFQGVAHLDSLCSAPWWANSTMVYWSNVTYQSNSRVVEITVQSVRHLSVQEVEHPLWNTAGTKCPEGSAFLSSRIIEGVPRDPGVNALYVPVLDRKTWQPMHGVQLKPLKATSSSVVVPENDLSEGNVTIQLTLSVGHFTVDTIHSILFNCMNGNLSLSQLSHYFVPTAAWKRYTDASGMLQVSCEPLMFLNNPVPVVSHPLSNADDVVEGMMGLAVLEQQLDVLQKSVSKVLVRDRNGVDVTGLQRSTQLALAKRRITRDQLSEIYERNRRAQLSQHLPGAEKSEYDRLRHVTKVAATYLGEEPLVNIIRLRLPPCPSFYNIENGAITLDLSKSMICGAHPSASLVQDGATSRDSFIHFGTLRIRDDPLEIDTTPKMVRQCEVERKMPRLTLIARNTVFKSDINMVNSPTELFDLNGTEKDDGRVIGLQPCLATFLSQQIFSLDHYSNKELHVQFPNCPSIELLALSDYNSNERINSEEFSKKLSTPRVLKIVVRNATLPDGNHPSLENKYIDAEFFLKIQPTVARLRIVSAPHELVSSVSTRDMSNNVMCEGLLKTRGVHLGVELIGDVWNRDGSITRHNVAMLNSFSVVDVKPEEEDSQVSLPSIVSRSVAGKKSSTFQRYLQSVISSDAVQLVEWYNDTFVMLHLPRADVQNHAADWGFLSTVEEVRFAVPGESTQCRGCLLADTNLFSAGDFSGSLTTFSQLSSTLRIVLDRAVSTSPLPVSMSLLDDSDVFTLFYKLICPHTALERLNSLMYQLPRASSAVPQLKAVLRFSRKCSDSTDGTEFVAESSGAPLELSTLGDHSEVLMVFNKTTTQELSDVLHKIFHKCQWGSGRGNVSGSVTLTLCLSRGGPCKDIITKRVVVGQWVPEKQYVAAQLPFNPYDPTQYLETFTQPIVLMTRTTKWYLHVGVPLLVVMLHHLGTGLLVLRLCRPELFGNRGVDELIDESSSILHTPKHRHTALGYASRTPRHLSASSIHSTSTTFIANEHVFSTALIGTVATGISFCLYLYWTILCITFWVGMWVVLLVISPSRTTAMAFVMHIFIWTMAHNG